MTQKSKKGTTTKKLVSKASSKKKESLSFDTTVLVKRLIGEVPDRPREVLTYRFGLGTSSKRETS